MEEKKYLVIILKWVHLYTSCTHGSITYSSDDYPLVIMGIEVKESHARASCPHYLHQNDKSK